MPALARWLIADPIRSDADFLQHPAAETRKEVIEDARKLDAAAPAALEATKSTPALHAAVNAYYLAAASLLASWEKTKAEQRMLETKLDEKQAVLDLEMKRAGFEK